MLNTILLKVIFLGTGTSQGIPIIGSDHPVCLSQDSKDKRLRVSVLVRTEKQTLLIDCGPDFRQQLLRTPSQRIDAVLFTHEHSDHTAGIDDLRPFFYKQGAIAIYTYKRVLDSLRQRFDYIFATQNKYPGVLSLSVNEVHNAPFLINNLEVTPIEVLHNTLPIFGYRIGDFAYITDAKTVASKELKKLEGLEVLVINALRTEPHPSHFNLEEALNFIQQINPKRAYLTHISHLLGFHEIVQKNLPENVYLAYDQLEITI